MENKIKSLLIGACFGLIALIWALAWSVFDIQIENQQLGYRIFFGYVLFSGLFCRIYCSYLLLSSLSFFTVFIIVLVNSNPDPTDAWHGMAVIIITAITLPVFFFGSFLGYIFKDPNKSSGK